MTLQKAIEVLEYSLTDHWLSPKGNFADAIKLGIEALKSVRTGGKVGLHFEANCLPGEAIED